MKIYIFLFLFCLTAACLNSCNKSNTQPSVILSTEEFIKYNINGTNYSFIKPADTISSANVLNNPQPPPTTLVYANRIPNSNSDYTNIQFERTGVIQGSTPLLSFFATQQTGFYPTVTTSVSPIRIVITEYGSVGEYIAGNFTGLFIGPPPNNNQYNITCTFRVKRKI